MSGIFDSASVEGNGPLTADDLVRLERQVADLPTHPCRLGRHLVSASAAREGGRARCVECGAPVDTGGEHG